MAQLPLATEDAPPEEWCKIRSMRPDLSQSTEDRRTLGTHKTGDLYLVQRALGHRQITTTEIYARVSDELLREAVSVTIA